MTRAHIDKLKNHFFASCPIGLEELLAQEVKKLETKNIEITNGGVSFESFPQVAIELILSSRIASKVYKKLFQFEIKTEKDLYYFSRDIKWKGVFDLDQTFKITTLQGRSKDGKKWSQFKSPIFLSQTLKDGIVDRFRKDCNDERPSIEKDQPDVSLLLRVEPNINIYSKKEVCTILIDMCGRPMGNRGYKRGPSEAPLRENLAAGIIKLTGYNGKQNLIDPMTGSGTLISEALLIKGNIPPTFLQLKQFKKDDEFICWNFQNHLWFKKDKFLLEHFDKLLDKYIEKVNNGFKKLDKLDSKVIARDINADAIKGAIENFKYAGLIKYIDLDIDDATSMVKPVGVNKGIIVVNPPYGERISNIEDAKKLYYEFGENLKNTFKNFSAFIFTGNRDLLKSISLRSDKKHILNNANLEARLVEYNLY